MQDSEEVVLAAFAAGADSYCMKETSRTRREFAYLLSLLQGFALVSPLEGFSQRAPRMLRKRAVEVIGEFKDAGFQLSNACKTSSLE